MAILKRILEKKLDLLTEGAMKKIVGYVMDDFDINSLFEWNNGALDLTAEIYQKEKDVEKAIKDNDGDPEAYYKFTLTLSK